MKLNWKIRSSSINKPNHFLIKSVVSLLLLGLVFRLYFYHYIGSSSVSETSLPQNSEVLSPSVATEKVTPVVVDEDEVPDQIPEKDLNAEKCDLFTGDWIPNPSGPFYTNQSCSLIEQHQNCMKNGRPDTAYLYWKWNPRNCELPRFNPETFLELMRNKAWALIGDSISRNHVQSLLCMLSTVEQPVEVFHDEGYKSRRWSFPSYNLNISVIWSPFLAQAAIFEDINGVSDSAIELHLDKLQNEWTTQYHSFDYIIISSGKWYVKAAKYYENNTIIGGNKVQNLTQLGFDFAYRRVLKYVFNYIATSKYKGMIFFRTSTPDHFENGEWFSGGSCPRIEPAKEGEIELPPRNKILREVELDEFEEALSNFTRNGVNVKLLDLTPLSLLRPDGHPGPYRFFQPFAKDKNATTINDCLHWCLPGPIDSWNDVIMQMVINS